MSKHYQDITQSISNSMAQLRQYIPDTLAGFSNLAQGATKAGALDKKTKELIALALGVAAH